MCQILSESVGFCRRCDRKHFGGFFGSQCRSSSYTRSRSQERKNVVRANAVVTCEIKLYGIILESFKCFISLVTMSETEIKLFQPLKEFSKYFRIISTTVNM